MWLFVLCDLCWISCSMLIALHYAAMPWTLHYNQYNTPNYNIQYLPNTLILYNSVFEFTYVTEHQWFEVHCILLHCTIILSFRYRVEDHCAEGIFLMFQVKGINNFWTHFQTEISLVRKKLTKKSWKKLIFWGFIQFDCLISSKIIFFKEMVGWSKKSSWLGQRGLYQVDSSFLA